MGKNGKPTIPKIVTLDKTPTCIGDDNLPFSRYMGSVECSFLKAYLAERLEYVMRSIIIDRPSTKPFKIGDASSRYIGYACPGHPTHKALTEVDFDYPTYSGKGTQYGKYIEGSHEGIWLNESPMLLDESKINWWATWQLIDRLYRYHKGERHYIQFIIHEKVYDLISKNLTWEQQRDFYPMVLQDTEKRYNHHTHIHFKLDGEL